MEGQIRRQVLREDLRGGLPIRAVHLHLEIQAPGPQHRGIDQILPVAGADHDHVLERLDAVDLRQELGDDRGLHVGGDARAAHAEQRVHLVEEDHDRHVLAGLVAGLLEHLAQLVLRLAHVLVEELRPLHVQEVGRGLPAGALLDALGQAVRHGLRDQRLAAAGRAVEQDALRRLELMLREDLGVHVGQLDRVAQDPDLLAQTADLVVRDVRDLLEHHLLDRRLRQLLEGVVRARIEEDVVADLELLATQRLRERHHALVVRVAEHDGAVVGDEIHDRGDLAARDITRRLDDVEGLVQDDELALLELEGVEVRVDVHAHLAPVHEDLGGAVLVGTAEDPVVVRRRAELVDLLLEELDLLLRLLQHVDESLVLPLGVRALLARQLVAASQRLELRDEPIQTTPKLVRVAAEQTDGVLEILHLVLIGPGSPTLAASLGGVPSSRRGGGDPPHHVVDEALSARPGIELAHAALSSFTSPPPWAASSQQTSKQDPCRPSQRKAATTTSPSARGRVSQLRGAMRANGSGRAVAEAER